MKKLILKKKAKPVLKLKKIKDKIKSKGSHYA